MCYLIIQYSIFNIQYSIFKRSEFLILISQIYERLLYLGPANGQSPMAVLTPVVLCISLALCFPSGTPPNAIILTNNNVTLKQMFIVGFTCTVVYLIIIFIYCYYIFPLLYDITFIPESVYTACNILNNKIK